MPDEKPYGVGETLRLRLGEEAEIVDILDREIYKDGKVRYMLQTRKGRELELSHEEVQRLRC
jgi:hypothetical protein